MTLKTPVRPPSDLASYHTDDRDSARVVIAIGQQTPEDVILDAISDDGQQATLVAGSHAVRCRLADVTPIH